MSASGNKNITTALWTGIFLALCIAAGNSGCKTRENISREAIAFYNCENFFDTTDNTEKDDDDFTLGGKYHYTQKIYEQKLHNIALVLRSMGSGGDRSMPVAIGLAEIENEHVLSDLVSQPEIARYHYRYIIYNSPDPRGINTALLYNPDHFHLLSSEAIPVDLTPVYHASGTRDILHVYGKLEIDTIHMLINHWPSRIGDMDMADSKRKMAATAVNEEIRKLISKNTGAKIIVMGDFNDNPTDSSIMQLLRPTETTVNLFDPFKAMYMEGKGTEKHDGTWNLFDQIILSYSFQQKASSGWHYKEAVIYHPLFICKNDSATPRRSFLGAHWANGYSDHFPVIVYFEK